MIFDHKFNNSYTQVPLIPLSLTAPNERHIPHESIYDHREDQESSEKRTDDHLPKGTIYNHSEDREGRKEIQGEESLVLPTDRLHLFPILLPSFYTVQERLLPTARSATSPTTTGSAEAHSSLP